MMDFDTEELSTEDGRPVFLWEFQRQNVFYRYTNMDAPITVAGVDFEAVPISDNGFTKSGEADGDTYEVTLPNTTGIALLFNGTPPTDAISVRVRQVHRDPSSGELSNAPILWVGTISGYRNTDMNMRTILCDTLSITFSRGGLRLSYGSQCPHMLYDSQCRVNKEAYRVPVANITVVNGRQLSAPEVLAHDPGWFDGGFIEWILPNGVIERRGLEASLGNVLDVFGTTDNIIHLQPAVLYPGCNRTMGQCIDKFENVLNFGGFPYLPGKSPFDGTPVF
jgi:uncharacterized phage protein (TIGR02218 family)